MSVHRVEDNWLVGGGNNWLGGAGNSWLGGAGNNWLVGAARPWCVAACTSQLSPRPSWVACASALITSALVAPVLSAMLSRKA
jgi:hypothetical protein